MKIPPLSFPENGAGGPPRLGAAWIAPPDAAGRKNYYFRARKTFWLEEIPKNAELLIGAESSYVLYLNGMEMGRGPARGTHTINYYDSYEVASQLKPGRNDVGVLCHCMNIETFIAAPAEPGVVMEIAGILTTDATWEVAAAGDEWRSDAMLFTEQTGFSEWRDLRQEPVGWQVGRDSSQWEHAVCLSKASGVLKKRFLPRLIPHLQETVYRPVGIPAVAIVPMVSDFTDRAVAQLMTDEEHQGCGDLFPHDLSALYASAEDGVTIVPPADGGGLAIVFDFGREVVGRFEMEISASNGTIIDLGYEEQLVDGRLRVSHEGWKGERYDFADRYILRDGRQLVGNSLMERGFRMVQIVIRNLRVPLTIHRVRALDRRYPLYPKASFHCSDPLLDGIWKACVETLSACTTDIFTDCPWRERTFWVNDLLVENLVFLQLTGDRMLPARALQMAFSETAANGFVHGACPCPAEGKKDDWLALPATNLFMALILKDYFLYTGDGELVKEYLPKIRRILEEFGRYADERGVVTLPSEYWNFFDWSYEANGYSLSGKTSAPLNYLYLLALKTYEALRVQTGCSAAAGDFKSQISQLSVSLDEVFFDREAGRLSDCIEAGNRSNLSSQLSHALALIAGEYRGGIQADLAKGLNDSSLLVPELYLHHFIFSAQKIVESTPNGLDRIRKYWGDIVSSGSPTIWEFGVYNPGKEAINGKGSLCHGFSTSPVDFFQTVILGIRPLQPGFVQFSVTPHAFDLEFAGGCLPTPLGLIDIAWRRTPAGLSVSLEIPQGSQAMIPGKKPFGPGRHDFEMDRETSPSTVLPPDRV